MPTPSESQDRKAKKSDKVFLIKAALCKLQTCSSKISSSRDVVHSMVTVVNTVLYI